MNNIYFENHAGFNSYCENVIDISLNCHIYEHSHAVINDENAQRIFEWKVAEEQDSINIQNFTGKHKIKIDMDG